MNRFEGVTDEDILHYEDAERVRALSRAEEFIANMDMDDVREFFGELRPTAEIMEAIRDEDEHELGSCVMDALRQHARDATT